MFHSLVGGAHPAGIEFLFTTGLNQNVILRSIPEDELVFDNPNFVRRQLSRLLRPEYQNLPDTHNSKELYSWDEYKGRHVADISSGRGRKRSRSKSKERPHGPDIDALASAETDMFLDDVDSSEEAVGRRYMYSNVETGGSKYSSYYSGGIHGSRKKKSMRTQAIFQLAPYLYRRSYICFGRSLVKGFALAYVFLAGTATCFKGRGELRNRDHIRNSLAFGLVMSFYNTILYLISAKSARTRGQYAWLAGFVSGWGILVAPRNGVHFAAVFMLTRWIELMLRIAMWKLIYKKHGRDYTSQGDLYNTRAKMIDVGKSYFKTALNRVFIFLGLKELLRRESQLRTSRELAAMQALRYLPKGFPFQEDLEGTGKVGKGYAGSGDHYTGSGSEVPDRTSESSVRDAFKPAKSSTGSPKNSIRWESTSWSLTHREAKRRLEENNEHIPEYPFGLDLFLMSVATARLFFCYLYHPMYLDVNVFRFFQRHFGYLHSEEIDTLGKAIRCTPSIYVRVNERLLPNRDLPDYIDFWRRTITKYLYTYFSGIQLGCKAYLFPKLCFLSLIRILRCFPPQIRAKFLYRKSFDNKGNSKATTDVETTGLQSSTPKVMQDSREKDSKGSQQGRSSLGRLSGNTCSERSSLEDERQHSRSLEKMETTRHEKNPFDQIILEQSQIYKTTSLPIKIPAANSSATMDSSSSSSTEEVVSHTGMTAEILGIIREVFHILFTVLPNELKIRLKKNQLVQFVYTSRPERLDENQMLYMKKVFKITDLILPIHFTSIGLANFFLIPWIAFTSTRVFNLKKFIGMDANVETSIPLKVRVFLTMMCAAPTILYVKDPFQRMEFVLSTLSYAIHSSLVGGHSKEQSFLDVVVPSRIDHFSANVSDSSHLISKNRAPSGNSIVFVRVFSKAIESFLKVVTTMLARTIPFLEGILTRKSNVLELGRTWSVGVATSILDSFIMSMRFRKALIFTICWSHYCHYYANPGPLPQSVSHSAGGPDADYLRPQYRSVLQYVMDQRARRHEGLISIKLRQ